MPLSKPTIHIPAHALEPVRELVATTALSPWVEIHTSLTGRTEAVMHSPRMSSGEAGLWEVVKWFAGHDVDLIANASRADADNQRAVGDALRSWLRAGSVAA